MPLVNSACLRCLLVGWMVISHPHAMAQNVRVLIQSAAVAGFRYHHAPALFRQLQPGDALDLKREPDNPHDRHAVQVLWRGQLLGYVPRSNNQALAWAMDQGSTPGSPMPLQFSARISALHDRARPHGRIEFDVFLE